MSLTRKFQRRKAREGGVRWGEMMHAREVAARKRRRAGLRNAKARPDTPALEPTETAAPGDTA